MMRKMFSNHEIKNDDRLTTLELEKWIFVGIKLYVPIA